VTQVKRLKGQLGQGHKVMLDISTTNNTNSFSPDCRHFNLFKWLDEKHLPNCLIATVVNC